MPVPQNFKNHARFDPVWHFFVAPLLLLNFIFSTIATGRHWHDHPFLFPWWIVMSIVLFVAVGKARDHSLTVQNRIIRLEERLRLATLLPTDQLAHTQALTIKQLIALRFASDAELPALLHRTLQENLSPEQIKQAVVDWRPDHLRV